MVSTCWPCIYEIINCTEPVDGWWRILKMKVKILHSKFPNFINTFIFVGIRWLPVTFGNLESGCYCVCRVYHLIINFMHFRHLWVAQNVNYGYRSTAVTVAVVDVMSNSQMSEVHTIYYFIYTIWCPLIAYISWCLGGLLCLVQAASQMLCNESSMNAGLWL